MSTLTPVSPMTPPALPFVGRQQELEQIAQFWHGSFESHQLRAVLLIGEAGIGKTRLIDESQPTILASGGAVVRAKLYPETSASIVPLVARALQHPDAGGRLLRRDPVIERLDSEHASPLAAVVASMRRLSRLRATLLILEDLHLMGSGALQELSLLLNALADETLAVLCVSRPVDLDARSVLERFLEAEIALEGLTPEECARFWHQTTGAPIAGDVARTLHEVTAGNPLALRSALRGASRTASARANAVGGLEPLQPVAGVTPLLFGTLRQNVGLLAEGLTAHLSAGEKEAAQRLACLGEVFSHAAAASILDDPMLLETLARRGIITTVDAHSIPLSADAEGDHRPYAFTHTLMHHHLCEAARVDRDRLVHVVSERLPLYSIVPFRLIADNPAPSCSNIQALRGAVERALRISIAVDSTRQWQLRWEPWRSAANLVERAGVEWEPIELLELKSNLLVHRLLLSQRETHQSRRPLVERLLEMTSDPSTQALAEARLHGLGELASAHHVSLDSVRGEVDDLLAQFPAVMRSNACALFLASIAGVSGLQGSRSAIEWVWHRLNAALDSEGLQQSVREHLLRAASYFLVRFENQEELERRHLMLAQIESCSERLRMETLAQKVELLFETGMLEAARLEAGRAIRFDEQHGVRNVIAEGYRLLADAVFSDDPASIVTQTETLIASVADEVMAGELRVLLGSSLCGLLICRDEGALAREIIARFDIDPAMLELSVQVALEVADSSSFDIELPSGGDDLTTRTLGCLMRHVPGTTDADFDDVTALVRATLALPVLRIWHVLRLIAVVESVTSAGGDVQLAGAHGKHLHAALVRTLEWLAAPGRELDRFIRTLLERYPQWLSHGELVAWRKRGEEIQGRRRERLRPAGSETRIRISMLGSIGMQKPGTEPQRFKGARIRMLLGMLVANRMLAHQLSLHEFCRLVAGGDVELEAARNILKTSVHRLRESLGYNAILTPGAAPAANAASGRGRQESPAVEPGESPRLNLELVRVDLLEAYELLGRTRRAVRNGSPMQAARLLHEALAIVRNEVPFPGLYGSFFEAVRVDFEYGVRTAVIETANALLREEDAASAESILRLGFQSLPGDDEIAELLCDALTRGGKSAEAERLKIGMEEE